MKMQGNDFKSKPSKRNYIFSLKIVKKKINKINLSKDNALNNKQNVLSTVFI